MYLILRFGNFSFKIEIAARASIVGSVPAEANTTSGSPPLSVLAQSITLSPLSTSSCASSALNHCGRGCLDETIKLIFWRSFKIVSNTASKEFASAGKYSRMNSGFLSAKCPRIPGSW
ncbi:hypothetical protein D3C75_1126940 [compost metagenome]